MIPAPIPFDEEERLAALAEYQILDTAAESIFDKITSIASTLCGVPICLISLIDRDRQWFKSNHGLTQSLESSRDISFCAHAILDTQLMEVPDATKDERFEGNPFVTENPNIRFYAGMPLVTPKGFKLGTLCVIDNEPKQLTDSQKKILQDLADIIIKFFEIKKGILGDINQRKKAAEALGIANDKLKKKLTEQKQSRQDLIILGEMSNVLQACMTSEEAYVVITKFCNQLFPQTQGALYLLHKSRSHVERIAQWGKNLHQEEIFSLDECWALRRGQAHFVGDPSQDLICKHMIADPKLPIYMCMPLMAQGEILGLLCLEYTAESHQLNINEAHQLLAVAMAEQVALALANAKLRETLHYQSIRDPLTGLFNRRYLTEILKKDLPRIEKTKGTIAFILIDIDFFKQFNDTYGHDAGDAVLVKSAELLTKFIKNKGQACRFGGEEFVIAMKNVTLAETKALAEELRVAIQNLEIKYNDTVLRKINFSIGISMFPEQGTTIDGLFNAADTALYQAKESGRNRVVVYDKKQ